MWPEALAVLKEAVAADEFNPNLRFALGEVLLRMGQFEEAITQLSLSRKLDLRNWQAVEGLAEAHLKAWDAGGPLSHRIAACVLSSELSTIQPGDGQRESKLVSLLAVQPNDPNSGRMRAREKMNLLNALEGQWGDYRMERRTRGWMLT